MAPKMYVYELALLPAFTDFGKQIITSENSPRYYNHVSETMGLPSSSLDDFYRFFRISGTGHCLEGPGACESAIYISNWQRISLTV